MKNVIFASLCLLSVLTVVEPIWAQDVSTSRTDIQEASEPRLSDLGIHITPQVGLSSFNYSGAEGTAGSRMSYGSMVEFGQGARIFEVGLMVLQTSANTNFANGTSEQINASYLTIPMMAKLRILQMKAQSWYAIVGFSTAFQTNSSDRANTNPIDVLGAVGLGGRFVVSKKTDFIIEATFNHGVLDAVPSATASSYNEGVLVLAGLSFRI